MLKNWICANISFMNNEDETAKMKIGIDKISFYVPNKYLDLGVLAAARGVEEAKYKTGLLINKMSLAGLDEDIVTMAASAALNIIDEEDLKHIDLVLFTTESGVDYSKSAATYLIPLLGLSNRVRAVELKQACYSTAAALYFAKGHILQSPKSKVLILSSDIARYGLNTGGEATQGAGATAMIISRSPRILNLENNYGVYAEDVYDFWRPDGFSYALVDGHFSNEMYQKLFLKTYHAFLEESKLTIKDLAAICFHIPYPKLGLKSLKLITEDALSPHLAVNFDKSVVYNREVGNIYTGSLFLSLISLLEQGNLEEKSRIGLYAYGSGAVAEFFSGTLVVGYKEHLHKTLHEEILTKRNALTMEEYEIVMTSKLENGTELPLNSKLSVQLKSFIDYKRVYQRNK